MDMDCVCVVGQILRAPPASHDGTVNIGTLYQGKHNFILKAIETQVHRLPRTYLRRRRRIKVMYVDLSANGKFLSTGSRDGETLVHQIYDYDYCFMLLGATASCET